MPDYHRILLIKPSSLGDIIHAMPVVSALKDRWPAAHLTWFVKRRWSSLVERIDGVDRVWAVDQGLTGWLSHIPTLRAERFDIAVDLQGLFRSAATGWISGAPNRIGFSNAREGSPWFYTHRVPVSSMEMHAVDRYLLVAAALGAFPQGTPQFRFKKLEEDLAAIRDLCHSKRLSVEKPWVAMSVWARWPTKRWPLSAFAAVIDQLTRENLGPVVLIGSSDEKRDVSQLRTMTSSPFLDLTGTVPLGSLPALLSRASVLITNDSGPMHVAAAVGIPVIALFGPTSASRTGPYGRNHTVLTHEVSCRPCFSRACQHTPQMECLRAIMPQDVVNTARHVLTGRVVSR
jgi:lipopolysaccharide heptosyltransferase I